MRRIWGTFAVLMLLAGGAWAKGEVIPGPVEAELIKVVDGDTLLVRAKLWPHLTTETHVRLKGIDAPELHSRCKQEREMAQQAKALLETLVDDKAIRLHEVKQDKYGGRVVARVDAGGHDLARKLLKAGLVRKYDGGKRQPWC